MTFGDIEFLKEVGIDPRSLGSLPTSPPPPETPILKLAEEDSRPLREPVAWEHEPEPEFIVPKTLPEYLARFPTGIREAVGEVVREMNGVSLPELRCRLARRFSHSG